MRADPLRYRAQYARTTGADWAFPLHISETPKRLLSIPDELHRLLELEAGLSGHTVVSVKKVPTERLDEIVAD